jgi:hypothetical protein
LKTNGKKTKWRIEGYYLDSCNCDWGCPCQFNARPTHGKCEGFGATKIKRGNYGSVKLDGLVMASLSSYPGLVQEGGGRASYYIDDGSTQDQFEALSRILTGEARGGPFEIYASTCKNHREPKRARIKFQVNGLKSKIKIDRVADVELEPIRNPVTGKEFRAIIELPCGFEASRMNQASSRKLDVDDGYLKFAYEGTYGSISKVSWKGP